MTVPGGNVAGLIFDIILDGKSRHGPNLRIPSYSPGNRNHQVLRMPVYSMTGYASAQHSTAANTPETDARQAPARRLGLEIRSVNSRFLDLSFRLPDELRSFEPGLRDLLQAKL